MIEFYIADKSAKISDIAFFLVWNGLMYYSAGMMEVDDNFERCAKTYGDYLGEGCGGPAIAVPFHILWMVFGQYTL